MRSIVPPGQGYRNGSFPGPFQEPPVPSGWVTETTTTSNRQDAKDAKKNNGCCFL
jgi:hypothetical protein